MIAARSANGVIGKDGGLPWSMPADEAFLYKQIEGCFLLTGRKSFESNQGNTLFKDKAYVIITRQENYPPGPGGRIAHSVEAGLQMARRAAAPKLCVLGGETIYRAAMPYAHQLIITDIHTTIDNGDAFFPDIDPAAWVLAQQAAHPADTENPYPYTFNWYQRR